MRHSTLVLSAAVLAATLSATSAAANSIVVTSTVEVYDPIGIPELDGRGNRVHSFFVTTDGGLALLADIQVTGPAATKLFQHAFGDASDAAPPNPAFVGIFPSLAIDSYLDLPGAGPGPLNELENGPLLPGNGTQSYSVSTDFGPQTGFKFAQLSTKVPGQFHVTIAIHDTATPGALFRESFVLPLLPEPASALLLPAAFSSLVVLRRSRLK
jgi:hypothetical protein